MRVKPGIIITTLKRNNLSVADTSCDLGIHRSTVYRWIKRAATVRGTLSSRNLKRKNTRPKSIHFALSLEQKDTVLNRKKEEKQNC